MLWSLGDYPQTARVLYPDAEALVEACGIGAGTEVLDVAAGNGNFAVAAARQGARVAASDLTPQMVKLGKARSAEDGFAIDWREADAEALPFEEGNFDVVGSTFGAMFAPRPEVVARELFRVTKPGGQVAMTNWTAEGFSGQLTALVSHFAAPYPVELPSPTLWGNPEEVRRRFEGLAESVETKRRMARFEFDSIEASQEFFERTNPALLLLKGMLPRERHQELVAATKRLVQEFCRATDGGVLLDNEYLVVLARKPSMRRPFRLPLVSGD